MSHGPSIMGISPKGFVYLGGFAAFFAFLSQSFKGPDKAKFMCDRDTIDAIKPYQPGLVTDYYLKENYLNK